MNTVISASGVYKKFKLQGQKTRASCVRDICRVLLGLPPKIKKDDNEFWALQNISFKIAQGESVALIGSNGSGKSTMLSIIAGIMPQTRGAVKTVGRMQAMINLGAGFNNRLSGNENIYNAAALAGMSKKETDALYDEIVAFAELGVRINSPVGSYSSGMKARLGFALASHLNPEIMLIDEVLSVGDIYFQNKCKRRMEELKHKGITMIMVSHSLGAITEFCRRTIWIEQSRLMADGETKNVLKKYQEYMLGKTAKADTGKAKAKDAQVERADLSAALEDVADSQLSFRSFGNLQVPGIVLDRHPALIKKLSACPVQDIIPVREKEYERGYIYYNETEYIERLTYELFTPVADGKLYAKRDFILAVCAKFKKTVHQPLLASSFYNQVTLEKHGVINTTRSQHRVAALDPGWHLWIASIPFLPLLAGDYFFDICIKDGTFYLYRQPACKLTITEYDKTIFFDFSVTHLLVTLSAIEEYNIASGLYMEHKDWPVYE
ncbi:MAG: ABC transporter ATP-binding protein [Deltaproteobacteria bacterium]|nr:ABC transporter ATP-binding protein [Deltaproteobacteria bacterium]